MWPLRAGFRWFVGRGDGRERWSRRDRARRRSRGTRGRGWGQPAAAHARLAPLRDDDMCGLGSTVLPRRRVLRGGRSVRAGRHDLSERGDRPVRRARRLPVASGVLRRLPDLVRGRERWSGRGQRWRVARGPLHRQPLRDPHGLLGGGRARPVPGGHRLRARRGLLPQPGHIHLPGGRELLGALRPGRAATRFSRSDRKLLGHIGLTPRGWWVLIAVAGRATKCPRQFEKGTHQHG